MEINPYAAPQSEVLKAPDQAEMVRREHINTEATIKSVGFLYYLGAIGLIFTGVASLANLKADRNLIGVFVGVFFLVFGLGQGFVAYGLRRLLSWARIPAIIFSCLGLLAFPLGTLINGYILARVAGKKGQFVMTPEYQQIIAATPHVKRKTSIATLVVLAVLIIVLIGVIAGIGSD